MLPEHIFGILMVVLSLFRFFYEFYGENWASFEADMGQVLSLPWTITGLWFIFWPVEEYIHH